MKRLIALDVSGGGRANEINMYYFKCYDKNFIICIIIEKFISLVELEQLPVYVI